MRPQLVPLLRKSAAAADSAEYHRAEGEPGSAGPSELAGRIAFNVPAPAGRELAYLAEAVGALQWSSGGDFTIRCQNFLERLVGRGRALLTPSCTAALEMAAILAEIGPGDEVIMPSWTFASSANAVVLRGGIPVFVDIRPDTLNIDERLIEAAITSRSKAITVVHYAGVAADMDVIMALADRHGLIVIEDAAHAVFARWRGRPLGSFGHFAALSFHATKTITSGEGGALFVNDPAAETRAEIIWEKGTNRAQFGRNETASYTWMDIGSSFLQSDLLAAFLYAQLEAGEAITAQRIELWQHYYRGFLELEAEGLVVRPARPEAGHNGSIFHLLVADARRRAEVLERLDADGISATFHFVPLHSAPAGQRFGRVSGAMTQTESVAARLIRLPLHRRLTEADQDRVIAAVYRACRQA